MEECKCSKKDNLLQDSYKSLDGLKIWNSKDPCSDPMWSNDGMECLVYVSCGNPCEKPCVLCLVWSGYGATLNKE